MIYTGKYYSVDERLYIVKLTNIHEALCVVPDVVEPLRRSQNPTRIEHTMMPLRFCAENITIVLIKVVLHQVRKF